MKKYISLTLSFFLAFGALFLALPEGAHANPSYFSPQAYITGLSSATGTPAYLIPGAATSTITMDTFYANSLGDYRKADSAVLLNQFTASSSLTLFRGDVEYSNDGIDWYQDGGIGSLAFGTTTKPIDLTATPNFNFSYASTTAGLGAVSATQATTTRAVSIKTPTRFVRVIYYLPIGSARGAIWATMIPVKEITGK